MKRNPQNSGPVSGFVDTMQKEQTGVSMPVFSIIMPCYNSAEYVRTAITSITDQTYPCWELVAVNDGSTDETLSILNEYASKDDRIKVHTKSNGGYVSAVNLGLEKITGDYFLMLGSDDRLEECLFQELVNNLPQTYPDCIAFRTMKVKNGILIGRDSFTDFSTNAWMENTTLAEFSNAYPSHAAIFSTRDTSKCFKRAIVGDLRYFGRYGIDADGIFSMLLCHKACCFAAIPVDGYYWTLRDTSLSASESFPERESDRITNWIRFFDQIRLLHENEMVSTEKEYLNYFANIVIAFWKNYRATFSGWMQVKKAVSSIRKTAKCRNLSLKVSRTDNFLLSFPYLWKVGCKLRIFF